MALNFESNMFKQSDVRENVTNTAAASPAWNLELMSYKSSKSITNLGGFFISPSGTKLYCVDTTANEIEEYDLSVPWDTSTAVLLQSYDPTTQCVNPRDVFFSPDGLYMLIMDDVEAILYNYTLSTAWDVTSATYTSGSAITGAGEGNSIYIRKDGLRFYVVSSIGDAVYEKYFSTAWTPADNAVTSFDVSGEETVPTGMFFSTDGVYLFVCGTNTDYVYRYTLDVPWEIGSAGAVDQSVDIIPSISPTSLFFSPNGLNFYVGTTSAIKYYKLAVWR